MSDDAKQGVRTRLEVAGNAPNWIVAVANLRAVIAECAHGWADVEIVDLLTDPERRSRDGVSMTPMLVKLEPSPVRLVLGSLRDRRFLLTVLALHEPPRE